MEWSQDRITELTRLWNEGLSTSEIGKRLGISKNAVVGKAHRLRLSSRPSPIRRMGPRPMMPRIPRVARVASAALAGGEAPLPRVAAPAQPVELSNHSCKWPIGHPNEEGFHFCTERAILGKPYCVGHTALAYVKAKAKGEAA